MLLNILLTNDDGWDAVGLQMLHKLAKPLGRLVVVAPRQQQSGISHQLTLHRPVAWAQPSADWYWIDGTPADCVRIALTQLEIPFDWVLSGVNDGGNLGADVYVSGTVAAAREACLHGLPSLALSQYRMRYREAFDWSLTEPMLQRVLDTYVVPVPTVPPHENPPLLNVNFPDPASAREPAELIECKLDPNPLPSAYELTDGGYLYSSRYRDRARAEGCDVELCFGGAITVSRL